MAFGLESIMIHDIVNVILVTSILGTSAIWEKN